MDLDKVGKFIAHNRKNKGLTQEQLAKRLGVTSKTVSRWETGKYMPDLSLLKPLSEELGITLNELLSGEKIEEKQDESTEAMILNTIDYSNQRIEDAHLKVSILFMILGIVISISALTILDKESSWCSIYSIVGIVIFVFGLMRELNKYKTVQKLVIGLFCFLGIFGIFYFVDYIGVKTNHRPPMYCYRIKTTFRENKEIAYYSLFYHVYRMNADTPNEYYVIDEKKEFDFESMPITPFNRNKSGIDTIIKYQNQYIGNNSNTGNLIGHLPLAEYGYVFEIDDKNLGLKINYHMTDWYISDDLYLQKSLIYNSVSIFSLIENVEYIEYYFSGNSYKTTRAMVEEHYPNYDEINKGGKLDTNKFNLLVESKMNDADFIRQCTKVFSF